MQKVKCADRISLRVGMYAGSSPSTVFYFEIFGPKSIWHIFQLFKNIFLLFDLIVQAF